MLVGWHLPFDRPLALPDAERRGQLEDVRGWAREGTLVCPHCRQLLWLRAGAVRRPHLAHRALGECSHSGVSLPVLEARRLIYGFFQDRVDRGKLSGPVELEPVLPWLPADARVDLILRRERGRPVAVVLVDKSLKPAVREALPRVLERRGFEFRPVFLSSILNPTEGSRREYLLSPTQRAWMHASPFGSADRWFGGPNSLHFVNPETGDWTSLRRLVPRHGVQDYSTKGARTTPLAHLLWSDRYGEWTHPNEPRGRAYSEAVGPVRGRSRTGSVPVSRWPARDVGEERSVEEDDPDSRVELEAGHGVRGPEERQARARDKIGDDEPSSATEAPASLEAAPAAAPDPWVAGFLCVGCGIRTTRWRRAVPSEGRCLCSDCAAKGVSL